jgi:ATP-dependent Lon protease
MSASSEEFIRQMFEVKTELPVLPLRDVVVFPYMVIPLFVGRAKSVSALEKAVRDNKKVLLVAQQKATINEPIEKDLFQIGTVASVLQVLRLPDGTMKVLVEGEKRVCVKRLFHVDKCLMGEFGVLEEAEVGGKDEMTPLVDAVISLFGEYVKLNKKIPPEILSSIIEIKDYGRLADVIAANLSLPIAKKQKILEILSLNERLKALIILLEDENGRLQMEKKVGSRVKKQIDDNQREYYLNEQMKAIKKELGTKDTHGSDIEEYEKKIAKSGMSKEAQEKAEAEMKKIKLMPMMSAEATVSRNYLDCLLSLPWKKESKVNRDLDKAEKILNKEHDGLEKVKERIVEYLAVQNRVKKIKGPILCLVGPPGVGKTSLGKSIAHATGREFARMSLGGVRDEAEIRGHRRTYIGALPGKIVYNLTKVGVKNPLFLLDEIDKIAADFRGDPASALLEVLDPEQNNSFNDHYLELDYDLSDVMFITTANTQDIHPALLDRMEVIELSGYTEDEKISIAKNHLIKKQFEAHGVKVKELKFSDNAIRDIIRYYTREAGVRNLERELAKICRKVVKKLIKDSKIKKVLIKPETLEEYLGVWRYRFGMADKKDQIGQVTGLAWTEVGGELLTIEAAIMPGKGSDPIVTGQLGDVMQESVKAAMTVVKNRAKQLGIKTEIFEKNDIHIHVPEGAIPKDGPSAGIAMCVALVSILAKTPVFANVAMTGEITLRGEILPIGGLKEKLLAARRGGIRHVIIPEENRKDLKEIPDNVKEEIEIHPVRWIDDVFKLALKQPAKKNNAAKNVNIAAVAAKKNLVRDEQISAESH